jgi:predicted transcriptional regulator
VFPVSAGPEYTFEKVMGVPVVVIVPESQNSVVESAIEESMNT